MVYMCLLGAFQHFIDISSEWDKSADGSSVIANT